MSKATPQTVVLTGGPEPKAQPQERQAQQLAQRVTELEIKLCFAEDWVETLNQLVSEQQNQIDRLQRDMGFLRQQGEEPSGPQARDPRHERPPHY